MESDYLFANRSVSLLALYERRVANRYRKRRFFVRSENATQSRIARFRNRKYRRNYRPVAIRTLSEQLAPQLTRLDESVRAETSHFLISLGQQFCRMDKLGRSSLPKIYLVK